MKRISILCLIAVLMIASFSLSYADTNESLTTEANVVCNSDDDDWGSQTK